VQVRVDAFQLVTRFPTSFTPFWWSDAFAAVEVKPGWQSPQFRCALFEWRPVAGGTPWQLVQLVAATSTVPFRCVAALATVAV
jgi:hypothetical protein